MNLASTLNFVINCPILTCRLKLSVSLYIPESVARRCRLRPRHRCFPVNFAKLLRTAFLTEHLWSTASNIPQYTSSKPSLSDKKQPPEVFDIKAGLKLFNFIKKRLQRRCFPLSFVKFLRITFLQNTSGRLPLTRNYQPICYYSLFTFSNIRKTRSNFR